MVKLRALGHVGRINDDLVQMRQGLYTSAVIQEGVARSHETPIGRSILIAFGGIVRPTIVPSDPGFVFRRITRIIEVVIECGNIRLSHPYFHIRILSVIDGIDISAWPTIMRSAYGTQTGRYAVPIVFFQNIGLLPVRTSQVDVEVDGGGMLHLQADIADVISRMDNRSVGKTGKDHLRLVGTTERFTRHPVGQEGDVRVSERGLRVDVLQVIANQSADDHRLGVAGNHVGKMRVDNGILRYIYLVSSRFGRTTAREGGRHGINPGLTHQNGLGGVAGVPKIGLRIAGGKDNGRVGAHKVRTRDGDGRDLGEVQVNRHQAVAAMDGRQRVGNGCVCGISDPVPDKAAADGSVDGSVLAGIVPNAHHRVETATVLVETVESILNQRIIGQIGGRHKHKGRVAGRGHPRPLDSRLHHIRIHHFRNILRQSQLPPENVAVIHIRAVHHLDEPIAIQRTSNQTFKRLVRMIELRSSRDIGGIKGIGIDRNRPIIRGCRIEIGNGVAFPVYQTAGAACVRVPFRRVVGPTIVPPCSRRIIGTSGVTRISEIIGFIGQSEIRALSCIMDITGITLPSF